MSSSSVVTMRNLPAALKGTATVDAQQTQIKKDHLNHVLKATALLQLAAHHCVVCRSVEDSKGSA